MMLASDNINIVLDEDNEDQQVVSILNEEIILNKRYLYLEVDNDSQVTIILRSGLSGAVREDNYVLSSYYIPYRDNIMAVTKTPYILSLLKHLNTRINSSPPTSKTSCKSFQDAIRNSLLCIEYFALKGFSSFPTVSNDAIEQFKRDIKHGWYSALKIKDRWDGLPETVKIQNWFERRSSGSKKTGKELSFKLDLFRQALGTAVFGRSLNDIPVDIVDKIPLPENLRTPYKYNGNLTPKDGFAQRYFFDAFHNLNYLFLSSNVSKPISNPEVLSAELATKDPDRTETPLVEDIVSTLKFLHEIAVQSESIVEPLVSVKQIMLNNDIGNTKRRNALDEIIFGQYSFTVGNRKLAVVGYRQLREVTRENARAKFGDDFISLSDVYKLYVASLGYLSLCYTGWRLEEIVGEDVGIKKMYFRLDTEFNLTEIERYIQKEKKEVSSREKTVIGPFVGKLLTDLHRSNLKVAVDYDESTSLFNPRLAGSAGDSGIAIEYAGKSMQHNPLRAIAIQQGIKIPTPKQLRRYFAVAYFYQYDNPDLLALSRHYGHDSLGTTEIYVTDHESRQIGRSMKGAIPAKMRPSNTDMEDKGFRKVFEDARHSKLLDLVTSALSGQSKGGFQATCRAMLKKLYNDVEFVDLEPESQKNIANSISENLLQKGYSVEPYFHANCTNSDKIITSSQGNCVNTNTGAIEREHASPGLCRGCAFHDVQMQHVDNLRVQRSVLSDELDDSFDLNDIFDSGGKTPLEIEQIKSQISELDSIIALYEQEANNDN